MTRGRGDRLDRSDDPSHAPGGPRTVLKFDAGRRGFGRAIIALAVAAIVLLCFSLVFLWPVLSRSFS